MLLAWLSSRKPRFCENLFSPCKYLHLGWATSACRVLPELVSFLLMLASVMQSTLLPTASAGSFSSVTVSQIWLATMHTGQPKQSMKHSPTCLLVYCGRSPLEVVPELSESTYSLRSLPMSKVWVWYSKPRLSIFAWPAKISALMTSAEFADVSDCRATETRPRSRFWLRARALLSR